MLLYRQTHPVTALVLAGNQTTLSFTRPSLSSGSSSSGTSSPQIELSLDPINDFDVVGCSLLGDIYGSLGLVQLAKDIFLCVISNAQSLTSKYGAEEHVSRILAVDFFSVSSTAWDEPAHGDGINTPGGGTVSLSSLTGNSLDTFVSEQPTTGSNNTSTSQGQIYEHPATSMRKILSNGHFYYSAGGYDISTRLEERLRRRDEGDDGAYDPRFVWNGFLVNFAQPKSFADPDLTEVHFFQ